MLILLMLGANKKLHILKQAYSKILPFISMEELPNVSELPRKQY